MRTHFRNLFAVVVLIAVIYFVTNYAGQIQQQIGVKGASTSRAKEIAGHISQDVGSQVGSQINNAKEQAMHINLSDILNGLSRFKRIPQDANSIKTYVQSEFNNVIKSKNKK